MSLSAEQLYQVYINQGLTAIVTLGVLYFAYKYIMMKMETHKKEVEDKLKERIFSVHGDISVMPDDSNTKIFVKLEAVETKKEDS